MRRDSWHSTGAVAVAEGAVHPATGSPWTLLVLAGIGVTAAGWFGTGGAASIAVPAIAVLFLCFLVRHLAFVAAAVSSAREDMAGEGRYDFGFRPTVTVMVPCHNEELVVEGMVGCLLALDYPPERVEFVVIDDGSTDATGAIVDELARRDPRLRVLHRPPRSGGGKSGALNAALTEASGEIIVVFDADHRPRSDVLRRLMRHFIDPTVGAVQGRCIVRNSEQSKLAKTIAVDYYCGYLVNEYGRQSLFGLPAYGGANCAVRGSLLRAYGGWNTDTVTEDTDLTLRLVLDGNAVRYDVSAIDTEEGVSTVQRFWRQRYRWARGHQRAWREYRGMVWRNRNLTRVQQIETTMFLLVYHVPVVCTFGVFLIVVRALGVVSWGASVDLTPLSTLLFVGPLLELATGLIVSHAPRRSALGVLLFLPSYVLFSIVCTKAWIDGVLGRPYAWDKTQRTGHGLVRTIDPVAAP